MQDDRRLLRALFRYGGDPDHALSWFGPATREQRQLSIDVFDEALAGERLPDDVRDAAPTLLWTLHMGILLFFLYDDSPDQRRTRKLIDAAVDFVVDVRRLATSAAAASDAPASDEHPARCRPARRDPRELLNADDGSQGG